MHRIVIVGGGAAGLELATRLGNRYGRSGRADVTLVERARTHLWKPLLHAVAAGAIDRSQHELNYLAQAHWHRFTYRFGEMVGLDRDNSEIELGPTFDEEGREITPASRLGYDTLIMAVGSVTNDFGTPGAAEHAIPLETPDQAARFNRRLINACLRANAQREPVRPGQLHVSIIGAGATGTELAAELHRTVREVVAYGLDHIVPERDIKIILVEAAPRILPALPERIADETMRLLREMGVEVRTGTRVAEVRGDGIVLADGGFLPCDLIVWAAGVKGPDFLHEIGGLETNRLVVEQTLRTTRDPAIFAIGDCAACPQPGSAQPVPPRAQAAHQMASHMIGQMERILDGKPLEPFVYKDFGSLVSLGEYSTVGSLMGFLVGRSFFIEGLFARLMYRSLYQMHLAALHGKAPTLWRYWLSLFSQRPTPTVKLH
jgi:NADH dehydrogenase